MQRVDDAHDDARLVQLRAQVHELQHELEERDALIARQADDHERAARDATGVARLAEQHRVLFERSPLAKFVFDVETYRLLAVNDAAIEIYGYGREELLAMRLPDLKLPGDVHTLSAAGEPGRWRSGAVKHRRKDGVIIEVDIVSQHMMFDGKPARLAAVRDVTGERRLEEQLRQSQKMDAIGRLAGGVAHDFNNILAVILTDAELALGILGEGHPVYNDIREIQAAGLRAAGLTRQLLTFSRQQPCRSETLELNAVVTGLERMLCRIIGEDIHVRTSLAAPLWLVEADRGQMEQVLLNLVVNARDAMPHGGSLTVATQNVELDAIEAPRNGVEPGCYVMLTVADTGVGMDPETCSRIFEPFFTTKEVGKGTGLGLATVFGIVKQGAGGVSVESVVGSGTSLRVFLPRVERKPTAVAPQPAAIASRGDETILVVEDDEQVRRVVCRLLKSKGYAVLEARNAEVALDLLSRRVQAVDLIVTDLVMPDIDGRTMAAMVLERNPLAKVLYMSGYTEHAAVKGVGPMEHFIRKPFSVQEMAVAVRRAILGQRRLRSGEMAAALV